MAKKKKTFTNRIGIERIERFVVTTDDDSVWTPCYEGNCIRVFASLNRFEKWYVKIAAWGADDYGVERTYFFGQDEEAAREKYIELAKEVQEMQDGISLMELLNRGFEPF